MKAKNGGPKITDPDIDVDVDGSRVAAPSSVAAARQGHQPPGLAPQIAHERILSHQTVAFPPIPDLIDEGEGQTALRRVKRAECLFRAGDEFKYIYAVRSGFFKTIFADGDGREQVTGFFMSHEHLGLDGLDSGQYHNTAVALEDSEVIAIPYILIEEIGHETRSLLSRLDKLLAKEIVRNRDVLMILGSLDATERLAAFLVDLSARLKRRGFSASDLVLRMTRDDIGSYLGLKLETVSRLLSRLRDDGLIKVDQRHITILDLFALEKTLYKKI